MLAEDFGGSVAGFSDLYAHVASGRRTKVEVRLSSEFREGSFLSVLQLVHDVVGQVETTFGSGVSSATEAVKLLTALVGCAGVILATPITTTISIIKLQTALAEKKKANIKIESARLEKERLQNEISSGQDLQHQGASYAGLTPQELAMFHALANDKDVRLSLRRFLLPAIIGNVGSIAVKGPQPLAATVTAEDVPQKETRSRKLIESREFDAEVSLVQANFLGPRGWRFRLDGDEISTTILDQYFLHEVATKSLAANETFKVRLREEVSETRQGRITTRYTVLRVLE